MLACSSTCWYKYVTKNESHKIYSQNSCKGSYFAIIYMALKVHRTFWHVTKVCHRSYMKKCIVTFQKQHTAQKTGRHERG